MSQAQKHTRRWFQFRLRTLFVVVTGTSVMLSWTAHSLNWIRERHEALNEHPIPTGCLMPASRKAPRLLWIFGEMGHDGIYPRTDDPQTIRRLERLFPEAIVWSDE
jgi:hypothetical protein